MPGRRHNLGRGELTFLLVSQKDNSMSKEELRRKKARTSDRVRLSARALIVVSALAAVGAWAAILVGNAP